VVGEEVLFDGVQGGDCRGCELVLQIRADTVRLEDEAAFSSRTRFSKILYVTQLSPEQVAQVQRTEQVGSGLMRVLNVVVSVLAMTGMLGFVDVLFKQLNFFMLLAEYN
jgi:hypothetical protein